MDTATNNQAASKEGRPRPEKEVSMIHDPNTCLTQRQLEFIALFASGYGYAAIAKAKFVSYSAVRQTLERAKSNVNADSLTHLCSLCQHAGLLVRDGNMFKPVVDPTDLS